MASNGRGQMRPHSANRSPPFVVIGLLVVIFILGFNYWNVVSKNTILYNESNELSKQLRENTVKRLSVEKRHEALKQDYEGTKSECSNHKATIERKIEELSQLKELSERSKSEKEKFEEELKNCENERDTISERCKQTQKNYEYALDLRNQCQTDLSTAKDKIDDLTANNVPSSKVNETRTQILSVVQQIYGGKALVELQKAGIDISGITLRDDILPGNQQQDTHKQHTQQNDLQDQNNLQQPNALDQNNLPQDERKLPHQDSQNNQERYPNQNNQQTRQETQQNEGNQQGNAQDNTVNVQNGNRDQQNNEPGNQQNQLEEQSQQRGNVYNHNVENPPQQGNEINNVGPVVNMQQERNQFSTNQGNLPAENKMNQNEQQGNVGRENLQNSQQGFDRDENKIQESPQRNVIQPPLGNQDTADQEQNGNNNVDQPPQGNIAQQGNQNTEEQQGVVKPIEGVQQNPQAPVENVRNQDPQIPPEENPEQQQIQDNHGPTLNTNVNNQDDPQKETGGEDIEKNEADLKAPAGTNNSVVGNINTNREQTSERNSLDNHLEEEEEDGNNLIDIDNALKNKNHDVEDENLRQDELQVMPNKANEMLPGDVEKNEYGDEIDPKNDDRDLRFQNQAQRDAVQELDREDNNIEDMREAMDRNENAQGPGVEQDTYKGGDFNNDINTQNDDFEENQLIVKQNQHKNEENKFEDDPDTQHENFELKERMNNLVGKDTDLEDDMTTQYNDFEQNQEKDMKAYDYKDDDEKTVENNYENDGQKSKMQDYYNDGGQGDRGVANNDPDTLDHYEDEDDGFKE